MENKEITMADYVVEKLANEVKELKVRLAQTEFTALVLKEENQQLKKTIEELEEKIKEYEIKESENSQESTETN